MCADRCLVAHTIEPMYTQLAQVRGHVRGPPVRLGQAGRCRYCHGTGPFRKVAHTFPEALGNKQVVSLDECDSCNAVFSRYEDALAAAVRPVLTLGGTAGKDNKVPQTGRSAGDKVLSRSAGPERSRITAMVRSPDARSLASWDGKSVARFRIPVAGLSFRARHAYKALAKMAFAILPGGELEHYDKLRQWLLAPGEETDIPLLDVGVSFGSIGNAPQLVVGTLIKRTRERDPVPYLHFIFCPGSVCLQISLRSDRLDEHVPPPLPGAVAIGFSVVLGPGSGPGAAIRIDYGQPVQRNWSSTSLIAQPIQEFILDFDPQTTEGRFTAVFRTE